MKYVNTLIIEMQKLCEPCTANKKSMHASFFCPECENEFLCETCGKHHTRQKSTRTHLLQDISKYMEAEKAEVTQNQNLCEPCASNKKERAAFYFCNECENEFLFETCGKHHTRQKSTRTHLLQDIGKYVEAAKAEVTQNQKNCEPCASNKKERAAFYFCNECENEFLCETCGKHHNVQKSTRTHKLQDINMHSEVANIKFINKQNICEPCKANQKISIACFFCAECEHELLCETCGKQHNVQKVTRTHILQDISQYMEAEHKEYQKIQRLCEPCAANDKSSAAFFFCAECENEFLCEQCGKHHNAQRSTRTHKLQDISQNTETAKTDAKNKIKLCESCRANEQSIPACFFCPECENEFLCEACGIHHTRQKSTRTHILQKINKYVEAADAEVTKNQKLCEPCAPNNQSIPACFFCSECENEFLCEACGKHHTRQKSTRTHLLQDISKYVKAPIAEETQNQKLCGICTANEKVSPACFVCNECENEFLCDACGRHHNKRKSTHTLQNICKYLTVANADVTKTQKLCDFSTVNEKTENTPGKPSASEEGSDTITLTWDKPSAFKNGDHFQIAYRECTESRWKICQDNVEINRFELTNLKSDSQFLVRTRAICNGYESNYSKESDIVTTRKSPASLLVTFLISLSPVDVLPVQYVLPMTKVKAARNGIGKTRKFELGSPIKGKRQEKTILLVGETGTGKSTLVEGMANFILGVNWNDEFRFSIAYPHDEERHTCVYQAVAQTEWITCYTIHPQDGGKIPYTINIIDTPGFGGTRGYQRDQEIVEQMRGLFTVDPQKGVSIIDSVCSVIKAQDARLTPTQGYLFQSIMSLFGKDMEHNICSLITFADGLDPPVKNAMDMSKLPFGEWFTFNNSALFAKNTTLDSSSMSQIFWEMGLQSFRNFFQHLGKLPPTSLKLTSEVLKERHELEAIVRNLSPLLDAGLVQINTLNAQIKCCEENKSIIADNKDFTFTVNKNKKLKKDLPVGEHVIKCLNCHFTCYEKFYISNDDEKRYCLLFDQKSGYCKRCPNKCFRNEHVIFPYIYEYVVVKEQQTFYDMKKIYEEASSKLLNQEQLIADIKADLNKVVENVYEMMETFNESKARLNEISLRPNPLTIKEHINLLIESEKMEKKNGWLDRLKSLQVFRKRADIDSEVNNFLSQATLHVTAEKKTERKKKKQK